MEFEIPGLHNNTALDVANAIRRSILSDVATLAPVYVDIARNDSVMSDSQLAHRIGGLVLKDRRAKKHRSQDVVLQLNVQQGGNARMIMSSDITTPSDVEMVTSDVPLVVVGSDHGIEATINAKYDTGSTHARFCPVEVVKYLVDEHVTPRLTIKPTGSLDAPQIMVFAIDALLERLDKCHAKLRTGKCS